MYSAEIRENTDQKKSPGLDFIAQCIKKICKKINSLGMILFINKVTPFGIIFF